MIVDTSAIIAILRDEADADRYGAALAQAAEPVISAGTYLETAIVVDSNLTRSSAVDSTTLWPSPVSRSNR